MLAAPAASAFERPILRVRTQATGRAFTRHAFPSSRLHLFHRFTVRPRHLLHALTSDAL